MSAVLHRLVRGLSDAALTLGMVMVLFAVYLLWWTNHAAQAQARSEVERLEQRWGTGRAPRPQDAPGAGSSQRHDPASSRTFAVLRIPRIGLTAPIAEGVDRHRVLDRGFVGHYPGAAMPGRPGNLALAAHRNTHGEPFRHLDEVRPGDTVSVTTADGTFTYRIDSVLPRTSPRDSATIRPVPTSSTAGQGQTAGYDRPGRYITLTTCTPEFTSRYRLVVWGSLLEHA